MIEVIDSLGVEGRGAPNDAMTSNVFSSKNSEYKNRLADYPLMNAFS